MMTWSGRNAVVERGKADKAVETRDIGDVPIFH